MNEGNKERAVGKGMKKGGKEGTNLTRKGRREERTQGWRGGKRGGGQTTEDNE